MFSIGSNTTFSNSRRIEPSKSYNTKSKYDHFYFIKFSFSSSGIIKDYCVNLRNEVDIEAEKLIHSIQNYRDEYLKKIADYEKECIKHIESNKAQILESDRFINDMKTFCSQWQDYLKNFKIEDDRIERLIDKSTKNLARIEANINFYRGFLFSGNLMKFKPSAAKTESNILGAFVYEKMTSLAPLHSHNDEIYKRMDLKDIVKCRSSLKSIAIESLSNDQYFLGYLDDQGFINAVIISKNGNVGKEKKNLMNGRCVGFKTTTSSNFIFVGLTNSQYPSTPLKTTLRVFDTNFTVLNELSTNLGGFIQYLASDSNSSLYVFTQNNSMNSIYVFDHNLNHIRVLQWNLFSIFSTSSVINKVKVKKDLLYLIESGNMFAINLTSGQVVKRFQIGSASLSYSFDILNDDDIYVLNETKQELVTYDFEGNKLTDKKLNFEKPVHILLENNNKISFFDINNCVMYFV